MKDIIRLLPDSIANQIAAGEVVQRPSSVVKELLENAIDAQATAIQVLVKEGGKTFIQIVDNGLGMSEVDARMCFERHATSKLSSADDLFRLYTLGFRGEAMASIAAVAQVELRTKRKEDEYGTCVVIEGSVFKSQEAVQIATGTSITVKNLFFNIPARRNFLKSNAVESKHILEEFQRLALCYPAIAFSFYQNEEELYNLPASKLSQRIVGLFGKSYQEQLVACQEGTDLVQIEGYVGKPQFSKKTRGDQFFFVNKRFVKSPYLHHAVMNAFEGLLSDGNFPFYALFITIDPQHIDVNVHPTKTEIKFDDEKMIYAILQATVRKALSTHHVTPSLDFEQPVSFLSTVYNEKKEASLGNGSLEKYKDDRLTDFSSSKLNFYKTEISSEKVANGIEFLQQQVSSDVQPYQINRRYIIAQTKQGLILVDQCAAHERIVYENYVSLLEYKNGASQQLLFPQKIELNSADFQILSELSHEMNSLGFKIELSDKNSAIVYGIPADIPLGEEEKIVEELLYQFLHYPAEIKNSKKEKLARTLAKRASNCYVRLLSSQEMNALVNQLFACANPLHTPSGVCIYTFLTDETIATLFK